MIYNMSRYKSYLEFIRYSLNPKDEFLMDVAKMDWEGFFQFANEQGILGVAFVGIQRLGEHGVKPPLDVLMQWIASASLIEQQNKAVNKAATELFKELKNDGLRGCILKGQGNGLMYPNVYSRTPGDIDVWVRMADGRGPKADGRGLKADGRCKKEEGRGLKAEGRGLKADGRGMRDDVRDIIKYVKERNPNGKVCYHHIDGGKIGGVEVEVHYRPSFMNNPIHNHRLQKWYKMMAEGGRLMEEVELPEGVGSIPVPTVEFNVVYQLVHVFRHLLQEGIGLRQIIDYYYVLKSNTNHTDDTNIIVLLNYLGLTKIAGAMMWLLSEVLGLEEEYLIVPKNERLGKVLLAEILKGGNFGQYDIENIKVNSQLGKNWQRIRRDFRMMRYFPSECMWEPVFRVYHFFWRQWHKYV